MLGIAQVDGMISELFHVVNRVKQGCVLAPTLFGIYFSAILREATPNINLANLDVGLRTRFDANLFLTSRLKAKTKTTTLHVCEALYADDVAICSHSEEQLQSIIDSFSNTCSVLGLKISVEKTVIMSHGTQVAKTTLSDEALKLVENLMSNNVTLNKELNTRPGKAATSLGRLSKKFGPTKA